jgi:predicted dehydrogenase
MLSAGPETRLAGVWARRPDAAKELASQHGTTHFDRVEALFDASDAVAFAVPPDVQAELAAKAARAGKALLLDKPIAADLAGAQRLAEAVERAGIASMVLLTWRYSSKVRAFIDQSRALKPFGGRAHFISGGMLGGPFMTPWRVARGPLLDLGPHVLDLLDATLGEIIAVDASGETLGWVTLVLEHAGGARSSATMCASVPIHPQRSGVEIYGGAGAAAIDCTGSSSPELFATVRREFVETVAAGGGHPLSVTRGLYLQRLIDDAEQQLRGR